MKKFFTVFSLMFGVSMLAQNVLAVDEVPQINPKELCETVNFNKNKVCTPGQKIAYLPGTATEEASIIFASQNCDPRYPVAMNKFGVVCIFLPFEKFIDDRKMR
jgi:hypothetical protein